MRLIANDRAMQVRQGESFVTATKLQRAPRRNAAFMRQKWARRRLLPDESGVPGAVARCARSVTASGCLIDRVGCIGLRLCTLPHHRTCGFPHPAIEGSGPVTRWPRDLMA